MRIVLGLLTLQYLISLPLIGQKVALETGIMLRKRIELNAASDKVWACLTSVEGIKTFFAAEARVELALNGLYEIYFDPAAQPGQRGSEGCRILSFVPGEMLSFTWNNPPQLPTIRHQYSWVVIHLAPLGQEKTQLDLIHLGFRAGSEWAEAIKYFDRAWTVVLARLAYALSVEPIDWKKPYTPK